MALTVALINSTMPEAKPIVEMGPIVDKAIKNLAKAEALRLARKVGPRREYTLHMPFAGIRKM